MNIMDAYHMIRRAMAVNVPAMAWGVPGIGKSSIVRQITIEDGINLSDVRLTQMDPTDLRGIPVPDKKTGRSIWYPPSFWPFRSETDIENHKVVINGESKIINVKAGCGLNGPGILFLDEIDKAPTSVKTASLELVLDRRVGSYKLPDDWYVMCAGNNMEDGAFSTHMGSAFNNRVMHLDVKPHAETWAAWARENNISRDIIAFLLNTGNELLYKQTEENAFPSPRSWAMGSKLIENVEDEKERKALMACVVGPSTAQEFYVWSKMYRNIKVKDILAGKMPKLSDKEQSFLYAVTMAVAFHIRDRKSGIKGVEKPVSKFFNMITPELRILFLKQQNVDTMEALAKNKEFELHQEAFESIV